jgi:queuosine precursor transporter
LENVVPAGESRRVYKYYDLVMAAFVTVLLCSGIIGVHKVSTLGPINFGSWQIGPFNFGTAIMFFPLTYLFGDILTEVYGYARSRRVIWAGFGALIFAAFMSWAVVKMPSAPGWRGQDAYEMIFGNTPRIVFASLIAFWAGEFTNSFVLAKMKILTNGRRLWTRTVGSTLAGEGIDSLIFYPLAFLGSKGWTNMLVLQVLLSNYVLKVGWEVIATPITYKIVGFLKRAEKEDFYDRDTNFNPFTLET